MSATPQKYSLISDKPNNWKPKQQGSPWFPTGKFMGMDLSPTAQGLLGFAAGIPVGGGTTKKQISNKLLQLGAKLRGGPTRMVPAGNQNVITFLNEIIKHGGASPAKKKLANDLVNTIVHGKPFKYSKDPKIKKLIGNIKANTADKVKVAPGVSLRQELSMNPYTNTVGRMNYLHTTKTPMIDIDLPIGQTSHMAQQMTHGMKTRSDFMNKLHKFLYSDKGKTSKFRLYKTQGGFRLFDTSKRMTPRQYMEPSRGPVVESDLTRTGFLREEIPATPLILGQDRFYTNSIVGRNQYSARLTPKPGRIGDYVTDYRGTYGYGTPIQKNVDEVINYHDNYIDIVKQREALGDPQGLGGLFKLLQDVK